MKTNFVNNNLQRNFFSDAAGNGMVQTGLNAALPGSGSILSFLSGIFGGNKPNPNDWKGWDALDSQYNSNPGTSPAHWVVNDGDSVPNEAANVLSYIKNKNSGLQKVVEGIMAVKNNTAQQALDMLYLKLQRGGFGAEATAIKSGLTPAPVNNNVGNASGAVNAQNNGGSNNYLPNQQPNSTSPINNAPDDKKDKTFMYVAIAVVSVSIVMVVISLIKNK